MSKKLFNRRSFLLSTVGLGSVLGALSRTSAVSAFTTQHIPSQSALGVAFSNRCGNDPVHAQILAKLEQQLATQPIVSGRSISMTEYCPFCRCPITATRQLD